MKMVNDTMMMTTFLSKKLFSSLAASNGLTFPNFGEYSSLRHGLKDILKVLTMILKTSKKVYEIIFFDM